MSEEQKPQEEEVKPEDTVTPDAEGEKAEEEVKEDRPVENYKAELERKNREIERLRLLALERKQEPVKRDPNDMKTWGDHELKAVLATNDPQYAQARIEANDILMDRKVDARIAKEAETHRRVSADLELKSKFPEALDPSSSLSIKMEELTRQYDLEKSPAGRLVAAKLAAAELNQGKAASDAKGRKKEADRVASVKSQMLDGDRPKPNQESKNLDEKRKSLADKLVRGNQKGHEEASVEAMTDILNDRFGGQEGFFGKKK